MRRPDPTSRWFLGAAIVTTIGASLGLMARPQVVVVVVVAAVLGLFALGGKWRALGLLLVLGSLSGLAAVRADQRTLEADLPNGRVSLNLTIRTDPRTGARDEYVLVKPTALEGSAWSGPMLLATGPQVGQLRAGDRVAVNVVVVAKPGLARGRPYAGTLKLREVVSESSPLGQVAANAVRARIAKSLMPYEQRQGAALLAGFLIGDTSKISPVRLDELRAAGLTHFVAVSGSNVALFLLLWWWLLAPFVRSVRVRAAIGLIGLMLFVTITRAEPSVVRASVMAGFVLVGRAVGLPINAWRALGLAVTVLVLFDGHLVASVGFQLSAAATAGVLAGAGVGRGTGPVWLVGGLATSVSAQLSVAPLLLWHFGEIPLFSPLTNLVAAPLVMISTAVGGIGTLGGIDWLVRFGVGVGEMVLWIASEAAGFPAIGWIGTLVVIGVGFAASFRRTRLWVLAGAALAVLVVLRGPGELVGPVVVFFDVGQGDSALVIGPGGETVLFDSGPDPVILARKLREYGIDRLDLVVLSHRHLDHVGGLLGVIGTVPIGEVWHAQRTDEGAFAPVKIELDERGILRRTPVVGEVWQVDGLKITVVGPLRHYANPNDESVVVLVESGIHKILFAGDVELIAQRELGIFGATILKVPHQGAATSDRDWLLGNVGQLAIVPVGPNTYGHPAAWVLELLEASGSLVCRTDEEGDIRVDLLAPVNLC